MRHAPIPTQMEAEVIGEEVSGRRLGWLRARITTDWPGSLWAIYGDGDDRQRDIRKLDSAGASTRWDVAEKKRERDDWRVGGALERQPDKRSDKKHEEDGRREAEEKIEPRRRFSTNSLTYGQIYWRR